MSMSSKYTTEQPLFVWLLNRPAKRCVPRGFAGILFSLVHLLLELLGLLLVHKRQSSQALLDLERVEEGSVLVVCPRFKDLLIPYYSSAGRGYVHQLQPVRVSHKIVGQHDGALESCVGPFQPVRICYI